MNTTFKFAVLDPRNLPAAQTANDAIFAAGPVFGIEVTVPSLAARCIGNLDPQHSDGDATKAAIEVALTCELPPEGATLATVRADLGSVGAMAVLSLLGKYRRFKAENPVPPGFDPEKAALAEMGTGSPLDGVVGSDWQEVTFGKYSKITDWFWRRLRQVSDADKFARGEWSPKPLPTADNLWPFEAEGAVDSTKDLAAIGAAVSDFKVSLAERVATMEKWLLTGEEPAKYREAVEQERAELVRALADGTIKVSVVAEGKIAVVESTHRAATAVGYAHAPVVIALNPAFRLGAGEPHRKFTVCAYAPRHADIRSALAELAQLEAGWGGSPTIGGSPQGVSSTLTVEQVVEVVARHLK